MFPLIFRPLKSVQQNRNQIFWGFLSGILLSLPVLYYLSIHLEQVKPFVKKIHTRNRLLAAESAKKEIAGFYPYWNLDKVNDVDLSNLTTVYYFAVDLNSDGTFNLKDPGISRLSSSPAKTLKAKVLDNGARWGVTIINLDQDSIAKNINNPSRQQTIINNTINLMKQEQFTALNIDLEYVGSPDEGLKRSFTQFIQRFTDSVHQEIPGSIVSFDAFADSIKKPRIFDMKSLGQILDYVIIMAYDFHRINSLTAGPVAPLTGKERYQYDITSSVQDYLTKVPPEKVVLGVPFYGYEWPTESNQKNAFVLHSPRGAEISSYHRSVQTAGENKVSINFDDESKSVWFPYFDPNFQTWRQVWFENQRSLGLKFDLVNQAGLRGIAIFALGYDGKDAQPLWDEVKLKFK